MQPNSNENSNDLSLEQVNPVIQEFFRDTPQADWIRRTWLALIDHGLAVYSNEVERCQAVINFVALLEFYRDWEALADENVESREFYYGSIPETLNLTAFRIGQLIGCHEDFLDDPDWSPEEALSPEQQLLKNGIFHLELLARPDVFSALQAHSGGVSSLFVALWNSDKQPRPEDWEDEADDPEEFSSRGEQYEYERTRMIELTNLWEPAYAETEDEILGTATGEKMVLFSWLDDGAEHLARY